MNNAVNARVHKLPFCPECFAKRLKPCTNPNGTTRDPHNVRELVALGLVTVKRSKRWPAEISARGTGAVRAGRSR